MALWGIAWDENLGEGDGWVCGVGEPGVLLPQWFFFL